MGTSRKRAALTSNVERHGTGHAPWIRHYRSVRAVLDGGVISWCFAAYYMIKTMGGFRPERRWGQYDPFSLLMPSFFTSEGNVYRAKLLRALGLFCLFVGIGMVIGLSLQRASP